MPSNYLTTGKRIAVQTHISVFAVHQIHPSGIIPAVILRGQLELVRGCNG